MPYQVLAGDQWHYQAELSVPSPGLVETVLPAGLFFATDSGTPPSNLDISLIGPEGKPRSFELYWKEERSAGMEALKSIRLYVDRTKGLVWEAAPPKNILIEDILIDFPARKGMDRVTIEGKDSRGWHLLAEDAALYQSGDRTKSDIHISAAAYDILRLCFRVYDKQYRETPFLAQSLTVSGKSITKDFAEKTISLQFSDNNDDTEREVTALLPGSGLWIGTVTFSSAAQFQGSWRLGQYSMSGGRMAFQEFVSGSVTTVGRTATTMEIQANRLWPGRSLVLKLNTGGKYLGSIRQLQVRTRLPHLVFLADSAGVYMARTGLGTKASIRELPGDQQRQISRKLSFSDILENRSWRPESLIEKFIIEGGPFSEKGYGWSAPVRISEPGFYRLVLNKDAALSPYPESIRLVKQGTQIPYFKGHDEIREFDLKPLSSYDKTKNITSAVITLPLFPDRTGEMTFESSGIFNRKVVIELPGKGKSKWTAWKYLNWQNLANTSSLLHLGLQDLPGDSRQMRIIINHGDNRPIALDRVRISYHAPTLLFLVRDPGLYSLFGENRETPPAKYDLSLVEAHLMEAVPRAAQMEELQPLHTSPVNHKIRELFEDRGWGLYVVLGLVTLILMILIVRLFPKEKKDEADQQ